MTTSTLDVGPKTVHGSFVMTTMELESVYPTLSNTQLPAGTTVTYDLLQSDSSTGSNPATLQLACVTQTGATNTGGAAGGSFRFGIPSGALTDEFVLARATSGTNAGNCVAATMTLQARF